MHQPSLAIRFAQRGFRRAWAQCFFWLALFVGASSAQEAATLRGTVVDEQGAALANAAITLLNADKTLERQLVTAADGGFVFLLLPPARYSLRVQCEGFRPVETTLSISEPRALRIVLRIGPVAEQITVNAAAANVNAAEPAPGFDVQTITRLPLNGGNLLALATLAPGLVLTKATADEQGQFSINGQRANANNFTVDGVSANFGVTASFNLGQAGAGALPALSATGAINSLVATGGVQEFKLQSLSFAAEFGRTPGGHIALTTRAGAAQFNGAFYDFIRHEALDANDWFANRNGFDKAALRQHLFGASFGGPLMHSTYFFANYEGLRLRQPLFGSAIVPDEAARQAGNAMQRALLQAFPQPNGVSLGNGMAEFAATYSDPTALDAFSWRVDRTPNARQTVFARYHQSASQLRQRTGALSELSLTQFNFRTLAAGFTQSFTDRATNDLRLNASFAAGRGSHELDGFAPRFGLAWQLMRKSGWEATLRGGVGRFYDLGFGVAAAQGARFPHYRQRSFFALDGIAWSLAQAAPPAFTLEPPYGSLEVFDPRLTAPRTEQWQLAWQQTLAGSHALTVAYVGAAGRQLLRRETWHNFNPNFGAPLYVTRNAAQPDYHALQAQWQRRLARGWQGLASYTWSHSLDFASNDSAAFTPAERLAAHTERGASDFDLRHAVSTALIFEPARDWSFSAIGQAQTSRPLNVTYARDLGFGFYGLRPDSALGMPRWLPDAHAPGGKRLNAAQAFLRPRENRQGTLPRNALRAFPFWQIDLALRREFALAERLKLQLRAEVYNALNHPNFAEPRGALDEPQFGLAGALLNRGLGLAGVQGGLNPVYQVGGARSLQLTIRLTF